MENNRVNSNLDGSGSDSNQQKLHKEYIVDQLSYKTVQEIKGISPEKRDAFELLAKAAEECAKTGMVIGIIGVEINTKIDEAKKCLTPCDMAVSKLYLNKKVIKERSPRQLGEVVGLSFQHILENQIVEMIETPQDNDEEPEINFDF